MEKITCSQLRLKLAEIKDLKKEFDLEMGKIREIKNTKNLLRLKEVIDLLVGNIAEVFCFKDVIKSEKEVIGNFFGIQIDVPRPPMEITYERFNKWKEQGFELHYLPKIKMSKDAEFPGWHKKKRPGLLLLAIENGQLPKEADELSGQWVLIDGRNKPNYENDGSHVYENDCLASAIEKLRERKVIKDYKIKNSRFSVSWKELNIPEVKKAFAEVLNVDCGAVCLPRSIEWNYFGSAYHPEWGETSTYEWFGDELPGRKFRGGSSQTWGLSEVDFSASDTNDNFYGFRLMVHFD